MAGGPSDPAQHRLSASRALLGGALLVAGEAATLLGLAAVELASLESSRLTVGATTAVFFVLYGAALLGCAWGLAHERLWSRGPVVLTQLIQLGVAWSFARGATIPVALLLAAAAIVVLVLVFLPASTTALVRKN